MATGVFATDSPSEVCRHDRVRGGRNAAYADCSTVRDNRMTVGVLLNRLFCATMYELLFASASPAGSSEQADGTRKNSAGEAQAWLSIN